MGSSKRRNGVDRNTEQWVSDQNKFWEKKGKTWKKPYPKCLNHKILLRYYKGVSNLSQEWQNKHLKKQKLVETFGMIIVAGQAIGMGIK